MQTLNALNKCLCEESCISYTIVLREQERQRQVFAVLCFGEDLVNRFLVLFRINERPLWQVNNGVNELFAVEHAGLRHVSMSSSQLSCWLFSDKKIARVKDLRASVVCHDLRDFRLVNELGAITRRDDRIDSLQPYDPFHYLELYAPDHFLGHNFSLVPQRVQNDTAIWISHPANTFAFFFDVFVIFGFLNIMFLWLLAALNNAAL
jgi:hypothetical protein